MVHQQGSHGIDQRRFSGADISREKAVFSSQFERPEPPVEGAPVKYLKALQSKTGQPVISNKSHFKPLTHLFSQSVLPVAARYSSSRLSFLLVFYIFSFEGGVHKKLSIKCDTFDRGIFAGLGGINV